jgi:hypothetical protein
MAMEMKEKKHNHKKHHTPLQIYLYVMLGISLLMGISYLGYGMWGGVKVLFPSITIDKHEWNRINNFKMFKKWALEKKEISGKTSVEETKKIWEENKKDIISLEQHDGMQRILWAFIYLLIIIPVFVAHAIMATKLHHKH